MNFGTATGIERKAWEDDFANRRKPRQYASFDLGADLSPYPLDFCLWLHRNFNGLVAAINSGSLSHFETW